MSPIVDALKAKKKIKTIIFVRTKEIATSLWKLLRKHGEVAIHHSSLMAATRRQAEIRLREGKTYIVVATVGFGMVRYIQAKSQNFD